MATELGYGHRRAAFAASDAVTPNPSEMSEALKIPPSASGRVIVGLNVSTSGAIDPARDKIYLLGFTTDDASEEGYPLTDDLSSLEAYNLLANSTAATSCLRAVSMLWFPVIKVVVVSDGSITFTFVDDLTIVSSAR